MQIGKGVRIKRLYQKITDIYTTGVDYDPTQQISIDFFKTVQNKLHWALTGKTAAEIIHQQTDREKPNMGLTNFIKNLLNKIDDAAFIYQGNYIPAAHKQYMKTLERIGKFSDWENRWSLFHQ